MVVHIVETDPSQNRTASLRSGGGGEVGGLWLDKTYEEIKNAIEDGCIVIATHDASGSQYSFDIHVSLITGIYFDGSAYVVSVFSGYETSDFDAENITDYPYTRT